MTSLSSLPASFSAEKRCKGKHFFSFHQNFFQVFFRGGFSGRSDRGTKDTTRSGGKMPAFHRSEAFAPESGCKSTHFIRFRNTLHTLFFIFFWYSWKICCKTGFYNGNFLEGKPRRRKNSTSIYTGVRDYIYLCGTNTGKFLPGRTKISIRSVACHMR